MCNKRKWPLRVFQRMEMWWEYIGKDRAGFGLGPWGHFCPSSLSLWLERFISILFWKHVFREPPQVLRVMLLFITVGSPGPARILAAVFQNLLLRLECLASLNKEQSKTSSSWPLWCHTNHRQCSLLFSCHCDLDKHLDDEIHKVNSESKRKYRETDSWMVLLCKFGKPLQNHCQLVRAIWPEHLCLLGLLCVTP